MTKMRTKSGLGSWSYGAAGADWPSAKRSKPARCRHCRKYFDELRRTCTKAVYLECDCPRCQGLCSCKEE